MNPAKLGQWAVPVGVGAAWFIWPALDREWLIEMGLAKEPDLHIKAVAEAKEKRMAMKKKNKSSKEEDEDEEEEEGKLVLGLKNLCWMLVLQYTLCNVTQLKR